MVIKKRRIFILILGILIVAVSMCVAASVNVGPLGIVFVKDAPTGASYSWNDHSYSQGFRFYVDNNTGFKLEVKPYVREGSTDVWYNPSTELSVHCYPLPDISWIKGEPVSLIIEAGDRAYFDLMIEVPCGEEYLQQGYWFYVMPEIVRVYSEGGGWGSIPSSGAMAYFTTSSLGIFDVDLIFPTPRKIGMLGNQIVLSRQFVTSSDTAMIESVGMGYKKKDGTYNTMGFSPALSLGETSYTGKTIIPREALSAVEENGKIEYYLEMKTDDGEMTRVDYSIELTRVTEDTVSSSGKTVQVADGNPYDGETSVVFPEGALEEETKITITQLDADSEPRIRDARTILSSKPVTVYDFDANGAKLKKPVTLTMLYIDVDGEGNRGDGKVDDTDNSLDAAVLKLFYWDGFSWRYVGGTVNTEKHTVTATVSHFSKYALFAARGSESKDFRPFERIITPNGDGINDYADFNGLDSNVKIFDIRGKKIRTLNPETISIEPYVEIRWNGRDDNGDIVESGVYLYQYKYNGKLTSGVIAVAK